MHGIVSAQYGPWLEPLAVLALGPAVIVILAAALAARLRSAVWQSTVWQVATLGLLVFVALESIGLGPALVQLARHTWAAPEPGAADSAATSEEASAAMQGAPPASVPQPPGKFRRVDAADANLVSADWVAPPANFPSMDAVQAAAAEFRQPPATTPRTVRSAGFSPSGAALSPGDSNRLKPALPAAAGGNVPCRRVADFRARPAGAGAERSAFACWPGWVWLAGAALIAGRMAWAGLTLRRFRRRLPAVEDPVLRAAVDRLGRRLGLRRTVDLREAEGLSAPVAFGLVHPTVVLPAGFAAALGPSQQEPVLAHELAHLAAGDPAWQGAADVLSAALWWHPLVWWTRRRLRAAGEAAADEASLLVPDGPGLLADCLVKLGRRWVRSRQFGWLSVQGTGFRSGLGRRVERLLDLQARPCRAPARAVRVLSLALVPVVLVLAAFVATAWARPQARSVSHEGGATMSVLGVSWRQSLAAMALAAFLAPLAGDGLAEEGAPAPKKPDAPQAEKERPDQEREKPKAEGERREGERREGEQGERREGERREAGEREQAMQAIRQLALERRELMGKFGEIRRKLEGLRPDQEGDAAELRQMAQRIEQRVREISEQLERMAPRERLQNRLEELKRAHQQAKEAGRADEAERLEREARGIMEVLEAMGGPPRPEGPRPEGPRPEGPRGEPARPEVRAEMERKLQHLRAAAENLAAAGYGDMAERLMLEARRMEAELSGRRPVEGEPGRPPMPPGPPPGGPPGGERAVMELREQVQQLRQQVEEIRNVLRQLMERVGEKR